MEVDQGHFQRIKLHKNCYDFAVQIKKVTTSLQPAFLKKSVNREKKACKSVVYKTYSTRVRFPPAAPLIIISQRLVGLGVECSEGLIE